MLRWRPMPIGRRAEHTIRSTGQKDIMAKPYQGHHCWNCWNVALWIGNDESLYRIALDSKRRTKSTAAAAGVFIASIGGPDARTPDGAIYNLSSVKRALDGLE